MNKVFYTIFGAISKDSYGEIWKTFGIDKVEETICHCQEKIVKRYNSGYSNALCHSIFVRLWCVKLLFCIIVSIIVYLFCVCFYLIYDIFFATLW